MPTHHGSLHATGYGGRVIEIHGVGLYTTTSVLTSRGGIVAFLFLGLHFSFRPLSLVVQVVVTGVSVTLRLDLVI